MSGLRYFVVIVSAVILLDATASGYDGLTALSDEFDAAHTLTNWQRIYQVEGWGNDVLQQFDINITRPGRMTMVPYSSTWLGEYRGELTFKVVTGDFVITTEVEARNRAGNGAPGSQFSLAGIMVRVPRTMTSPEQWTPGGENYVLLSLGAATSPGTVQYETMFTHNSDSVLLISPNARARATIQIARSGPHLIMLLRDEDRGWHVHQRVLRRDMPATLQAGLTVYTDLPTCSAVGFQYQNQLVLTNGLRLPNGVVLENCNPDLVATFDYVRYARPAMPVNLAGANLSDAAAVSDEQLLSFLGESANVPGGAATAPMLSMPRFSNEGGFSMNVSVVSNRSYRVERSIDFADWITQTNFVSTGTTALIRDPLPLPATRFYRAVSP